MRRSIATVSLSGTLRAKLEAAAAARFDAVELFEADFIHHRGGAAELRSMLSDLGLGIDLYQPFRDFEGLPEPQHRAALERAERKFDLMQQLGAPMVLVCSNTLPSSLPEPERAAEQLRVLAERAAARGLRVGFEALAWGRHVKLWREAWGIVEQVDHPSLGLILDSFHTYSLGDDPDGIAALPGEKIFFLQMADAPLLAMDVLQWARHHRNFPGQGEFDCERFLEPVLRAGYTGTLSLEIFNDVFRATPNRRTALDAMRSLLFLESQVRARFEAVAADDPVARQALDRVPLFDPPAAPALAGYAFLEFGVDAEWGAALADWLGGFGFVRHGSHRTKDAVLLRQGDAAVVLNADTAAESRARFDEWGAGVHVIGLASADPARSAGHGGALLSARRDSARGAGELVLPAVVAPGGTLIQFVPVGRAIDPDFGASQAPAREGADEAASIGSGLQPAPAARPLVETLAARVATSRSVEAPLPGLTRIDHIAIGLANDQLDTWTLFGRSVLGLERGASAELADPFGLIRSGGFANADRGVRLVLNVSSSDRTRSARQRQAAGAVGASVQHIAFACDDIRRTVAALRDRGARFVPISANYYDDLIARLALDEPWVRSLQALDVLVDVGSGGALFLHAYSEPFADRFFVEIVERRGGYDGYGALNAAARLASQQQQDAAAPPPPTAR